MEGPTLDQALQDVEARFLYNLPETELTKSDRLFIQIEQAYWYYEDYKADKYAHLPHFKSLKQFAEKLFTHCDLLKDMTNQFGKLLSEFGAYKSKIPVCGCILLNPDMNKILLVRDAKSDSWTFPRGKINENEEHFACAIREVSEEIGFNATPHCNKDDYLVVSMDGKMVILFIGTGVPESTDFSIQCKKEISGIQFFPYIPKPPINTYHVLPFLDQLRKWVKNRRIAEKSPKLQAQLASPMAGKVRIKRRSTSEGGGNETTGTTFIPIKAEDAIKSPGGGKLKGVRNEFDNRNAATFEEHGGWSVHDMFRANSEITGKAYAYDGNPHDFGSSHPRYTNYSETKNVPNGRSVFNPSPDADLAFSALSKQSFLTGEALLRGRNASNEAMTSLRLPRPITRKLFPPVVFNVEEIMTAVNTVLRDTSC